MSGVLQKIWCPVTWLVIRLFLCHVPNVASDQECVQANMDRASGGSCNFQQDFCGWENVHNSYPGRWERRGDGTNYFIQADVSRLGVFDRASLESPLLCATGDTQHTLSFRYYLKDNYHCQLSVYLWTKEARYYNGRTPIWTKTSSLPNLQQIDTRISIPSTHSSFQIVFEGKRLEKSYILELLSWWVTESCSVIQLDNIQYESIPKSPSSKTNSPTSATAVTFTTIFSAATSAYVESSQMLSTSVKTFPPPPSLTSGTANTTLLPTSKNKERPDKQVTSSVKDKDAGNSLGIGVGVAIAVIAAVVIAVIVFIFIRRKRNDSGSDRIPPCLFKKPKPKKGGEAWNGEVDNVTYSSNADPSSVPLATNGVHEMYARVNKPNTIAENKTPAANTPVPQATLKDNSSDKAQNGSEETDYYSTPNDTPSTANNHAVRPKGDNGYELAAATALYSTPGNTTKTTTKVTADANAGSEHEYNKLSHGPSRVAGPGGPHTNDAYDHMGEQKQSGPTQQAESCQYSLARPMETPGTSSKSGSRKQNYVNMNPDQTIREEEYNSLDFDHGQRPEADVRGHVSEGGHGVYSHLQGEDQYRSLDFDGRGQNMMSDSHIGGNQTSA